MLKSLTRNLLTLGLCLWITTTVIGCGPKVEGKYADATGAMTVEFKSGKATLTVPMFGSDTADYTIEGKKVTIKNKDADMVLTINDDGSLSGPSGVTLKKVP